jgi:heme-degrading monooxygenase HmoA
VADGRGVTALSGNAGTSVTAVTNPPASSTIATGADLTTLINVFTVTLENQQRLVDVLTEATEKVIQHQPGFVSANIHASDDGERVVNYAQWASDADLAAMQKNPLAGEHMAEAAAVAVGFEPHLYRVMSVHHA